jgi:magnesium-transporting ATPase (P-type)
MSDSKQERYQELYDESRKISNDIHQRLLSLSSAIFGAFFLLLFNPKLTLDNVDKTLAIASIALFGLAILLALQIWHMDADRAYLVASAIDPKKKKDKDQILHRKRSIEQNARVLKTFLRFSFLVGIILAALFLINYVW